MGDEPTSMEPGMLGNYIKPELPQLVPSRPPGLLPIPGRGDPRGEPAPPTPESSSSQDTKQVQAAMAMAAIYSQSPWAAIAMAQQRERLQQQMHATVPHPAAQAAAAAAAGGAPRSLPPNLTMGLPGLPHMQGLPGAQQILEHSRQQDLIRDYLTKLAQSTLNVTTSMGTAPGPTSPQYLQSFSTSTTADSKTEKPLPATTVRRSLSPASTTAADQISSTSRKSPPTQHGLWVALLPKCEHLWRSPRTSLLWRHASHLAHRASKAYVNDNHPQPTLWWTEERQQYKRARKGLHLQHL